MKFTTFLMTALLSLVLASGALADTFGSVEPIANPAVLDTSLLQRQPLAVREAFARQFLQCGIVDQVIEALAGTRAINTINGLNTRFEVGAGGFAGATNPAYVYTVIDSGPNAASHDDIKVLTDSLGYVFSQASAFLLDADNPASFDFPANYVVLNFPAPPRLGQSAALFKTVGHIDTELFSTDTSGYTQYGRAYVSLRSAVSDEQFIAGYVEAARRVGVEYTPIVNGQPSLFQGGAAFPGNDWTQNPGGQEYLSRIPAQSHRVLRRIRAFHLQITQDVLRTLEPGGHHDSHGDGIRINCQ